MSSTAAITTPVRTRRLADVRMADVAEVGGKAASLGELLAAGVRVPDGVVLAPAAAGMTPERTTLAVGCRRVGPRRRGPFAVRSSGIAEDGVERSFAGMLRDGAERVARTTSAAAVDRCLASAPRPGSPSTSLPMAAGWP